MRHTGNRIGGSNPSLSASIRTSLSDWIHWQKYRHATSTSLTPGIYGDFSNPRSNACADTLSKHAIIPQQQFAYTTGKNASDITLVIDAMDLLHSGRFDGYVWFRRTVILPGSRPASGSKASMCLVLGSRKRQRASVRHAA